MVAYIGVDQSTPVEASDNTVTTDNTVQTVPTPDITTLTDGAMVVRSGVTKRSASGDISFSVISGSYTLEGQDVTPPGGNPNRAGSLQDLVQASHGATGTANIPTNITPDNCRFPVGITLAIKPATATQPAFQAAAFHAGDLGASGTKGGE
jgi:hypothetical protein